MLRIAVTVSFSLALGQGAMSQPLSDEAGIPYIKNYPPEEFGASPENYAIVQDGRRVMYFGNTDGVLEYDGAYWRLIRLSNGSFVWSLGVDESSTVYVGGYQELGYLAADSIGQMQYVSLLPDIDEKYRRVGAVWKILTTKEGVYFTTSKYLLRFMPRRPDGTQKFKVWEAKTAFYSSVYFRDEVFLIQKDIGLMRLAGDSLKAAPGADLLSHSRVVFMLPYVEAKSEPFSKDLILIADRDLGLYSYDGTELQRFGAAAMGLPRNRRFYCGRQLASGDLALGSETGLIILDESGNLKSILNEETGLLESNVSELYQDREKGLWLSSPNGISRIEIASPFTVFDSRLDFPGICRQVIRHRGKLYAATSLGVYELSKSTIDPAQNTGAHHRYFIKKLPGITADCWALLSIAQSLMVATSEGVFVIEGPRVTKIRDGRSFGLLRSKQNPNRVFVGLLDGLGSLLHIGKADSLALKSKLEWGDEGHVRGVGKRLVRSLVEDDDGGLWLGGHYKGYERVEFSQPDSSENIGGLVDNRLARESPRVEYYDSNDGLSLSGENRVFSLSGKAIFPTDKGIYRFNTKQRRFLPDSTLNGLITGPTGKLVGLSEDEFGNPWSFVIRANRHELGVSTIQPDGTYRKRFTAPIRFRGGFVMGLYIDKDGVAWLGGDHLIRYDSKMDDEYRLDFSALIRRVVVSADSVVYGGAPRANAHILDGRESRKSTFEYRNRSLRFEYAAPFFDNESANRFQYVLEGFDANWSTWSKETRKDYTNLPEGRYRFRVRAKNIYEKLSKEDAFAFRILPPWYRAWWAYGVYVLLFFGLLAGGSQWRSRKLTREKEELEQIVAQRTAEVKEQAEKLREMDKLKSRFFANISHEFRTPLTLILGPLKEMISGEYKGDAKREFSVMHRNAGRLLRLINQLLELSKLESGVMKIQASPGNIVPLLRGMVNSFESAAVSKRIKLTFTSEADEVELYFDRDKLEQIVMNLLSNALKFTPGGGGISVVVTTDNSLLEGGTTAGVCQIVVQDTGIGIAKERQPFVFNRFYQVDSSETRNHEGAGIGLALTKELVELHHGSIRLQTEESKGATFIIRLPLGKEHLKPGEIIEPTSERERAASGGPQSELENLKPEIVSVPSCIADQTSQPALTESEAIGRPESEITNRQSSAEPFVLIVEDNADVRAYIRQHLEPSYKVLEAANGVEGLDMARRQIPDLIISDVMMPEMDGYKLSQTLKSDVRTSHIPVILLTAKASEEHKIEGLETGADDYLIKPFNSKELMTRVNNLIALRKQLQAKYVRDFLTRPSEVTVSSMEDEFLQKARDSVERRLSDPELTIEAFAHDVALSRFNLHRKLRALVGKSPSQFIRSIRLRRAANLLRQKSATVTEIAFEVGFSNSAYFAKCFKEEFGRTPSDYLRNPS